jgi:ABC-type bacteriocin/lantibiotic exporters, contain an N-terminal double-glycine peptidase domain
MAIRLIHQHFFVSTPSSSDYKRRASPALFDIEDDGRLTIVQRAKNICKLPSFKLFALLGKSKRFGDFDDSAWSDDDWASDTFKRPIDARKHRSHVTTTTKSSLKTKSPVDDILGRFHSSSPVARKSTTNLLSSDDMHQLGALGRSMGFTDFMALSFMYLFIEACVKALGGAFSSQQWLIPQTPDEVIMTLRQILSTIAIADVDIFHTWAPFAFIAYVLSILTRKLIFELKSDKLLSSISDMIKAALENSQLFLRMASGAPFRHNLTTTFAAAVRSQSLATLEIARLRTFVFLTVCTILASSVAIVRPICTRIVMAVVKIISLAEVREWPIEWSILGGELKNIVMTLGHDLRQLLAMEVQTIVSNPLRSISLVSVLSTLLLLSQLSVVERRRSKFLSTIEEKSTKSEKMDAYDLHIRNVEKISNLGVSSANRLRIQMENGAIERILLHESASLTSRPKCSETVPAKRSILLRKVAFAVICGALVTLPVGVYVIISLFTDVPLDSRELVNICLMLLFAYFLTTRALFAAIDSSREMCHIAPFLRNLSNTMNEVNFMNQVTSGSSVSSQNKGVEISNLWAAHARKRAWACRGVNITCRAGEVVAVLGDESCGKTRLLATIGESLAMPPKRSRTTTIARGSISIGGIETQKWNILELRRKIGVMLNDARTLSDMSQLFSGLSLYDILRPTCPIGTHEGAVKSAVDLAIEFTGISKSLLPRLPTKLNTLVTANEDDMTNSNRNVVILSASEWSKVLLTKLIAQIILTNDNPMSATSSITRSLLGSVLLLDDVTNHLNEIEEIKLIKTLRHSGAATLMTSKRWTIGRFATRIVVLHNGSVVESGTHAELIARGADNSLYAARWAQMMSS